MARRVKKSVFNKFIIVLLLVAIGVGGYFTYDHFFKENDVTSTPSNNKKPKKDEPKEEVYKINLLATGDGLIHNAIYKSYIKDDGSYDFSGALTEVKDIVSKYDIAYYNQETPFAGKGTIDCGGDKSGYCGYPRFNTPSEYGDAMIDAGFNTVSLASNHSIDSGEKGVLNSVKYWKSKNVLYNGMAESETDRNTNIIKEKNNITYAFLSYTESTNGLPVPKSYLVNVYDKEKVKADIEAIRDKVDVLIVAMHWGVEYTHVPNDKQKEMAEYLASLDVDIIIGNHPHVLQPITWIDDTLVMYSLGNFISNQYSSGDYSKRVGFMATLDITKTVKDNKKTITIDNLGGELIFTHYKTLTKEPNNRQHQVIPFSKMTDGTYVKDYERLYTKYTGILNNMGANLNITPLSNA